MYHTLCGLKATATQTKQICSFYVHPDKTNNIKHIANPVHKSHSYGDLNEHT